MEDKPLDKHSTEGHTRHRRRKSNTPCTLLYSPSSHHPRDEQDPLSLLANNTANNVVSPRASRSPSPSAWQLPISVFSSKKKPEAELDKIQNKDVRRFYEKQNRVIEALEAVDSGKVFDEDDEEDNSQTAVRLSLFVNIILFISKIYASYLSGSLSIVSSAVDSFLDLFSGVVIWYTSRKSFTNPYDYPAGKKTRLEPLGVMCSLLSWALPSSSSFLSRETGSSIAHPHPSSKAGEEIFVGLKTSVHRRENLGPIDSSIILGVILIKFSLWMFCSSVKNNPGVNALAQDHRNDVFTNSFALIAAFLGSFTQWWFDPLGAALIGIYIVIFWANSGYSQVKLLAGFRCKRTLHKQLIYLVWNHDPLIKLIDTVRAFHFGSDCIVEVDVVLPQDTPLTMSHDVGEALQIKIETIPGVDRAYVHLDYEFEHKPEHKIAENAVTTPEAVRIKRAASTSPATISPL